MLDKNAAAAGHGRAQRKGPARKSTRPGPGCSAAAQRSPQRTSHLSPLQERVRKGGGAREPRCWISQQQAADKIYSGEDGRVRAGHPGTAKVFDPKVLRGGVGHRCFLRLISHPFELVARENLQQNNADCPHIPGKKIAARHCTKVSVIRKLWSSVNVRACIVGNSKLLGKTRLHL